jgi:isopenicillin-N epimerase
LEARKLLCQVLQINPPCPEELIGAMASVPLPDAPDGERPGPPNYIDRMQDDLLFHHGIEVPVISWPAFPKRLLRISAQLYNEISDYEKLAGALKYLTPAAH